MKNIRKKVSNILFLILLAMCGPAISKVSAQYQNDGHGNDYSGGPSYQTFYDDLADYGQWVQDPEYGYVWVPDVDNGFRPYYSNGHWVMTEYGNTWVSDYPWGWAAFHYGRWTYNPYYGWVWIPGNTWGPAWVSWRDGGGYYGWAPLGPGVDVSMSYNNYYCPEDWWVFIQPQYLYHHHYYRYWAGPRENAVMIQRTAFVHNTYMNNNITYVIGPRSNEVQRITGQSVPMYHLANSGSRTVTGVHGNEVRIYHPMEIGQAGVGGRRPAPANVMRAPQGVGRPQAAEAGSSAPAFRSVMTRSQAAPPQPQRQAPPEENALPIAPKHIEVPQRHQIQTDEHVVRPEPHPQPAAQPVPQQPTYNRGAENVPQRGSFGQERSQPEPARQAPPTPQPQRPAVQPAQPPRSAPQQQRAPQTQPQRQAPAPAAPRTEGRR